MPLDSQLLNRPAPGFEVVEQSDDRVVLHYKQPTRGCSIAFLVVFGIFWCVIGGIVSIATATVAQPMVFFPLGILALGIVGLILASQSVLKTYTLTIEPDTVSVSPGNAGQARTIVERQSITRIFVRQTVVQRVNTTPNGPMYSRQRIWSVDAYTPSQVRLLPSAGQDQCVWFGNLIGEWAGCLVETDN